MKSQEKKRLANRLRQIALRLVYESQSGHLGGSYSAAEIYIEILFEQLRLDTKKPASLENDIFVVDKGHATPGFFAAQHLAGLVTEESLSTYRRVDAASPHGKSKNLQGHPKYLPQQGIWFSTGSLGVGISQAVGMAIAEKMAGRKTHIYVLLSDGGLQEGIVWEAARNAAYHKLDNLTAVLDLNWIQNDDFVFKTTELLPVRAKWVSFGWEVFGEEVAFSERKPTSLNGHDFDWLSKSFEQARAVKAKPSLLIANTAKGRGISEIENSPEWHAKAPSPEQYQKWIAALQREEQAMAL
ncbi:transketolase [Candidatus Acetothermia bacterium]|nr:transketolase [Candidatus Acetothermia bacterium]MBI3643779.1 transketolase [Candidatus Acetothermia bacterium]